MNKIVNVFETFKGKDKGNCGHHYGSSYMEAFAIQYKVNSIHDNIKNFSNNVNNFFGVVVRLCEDAINTSTMGTLESYQFHDNQLKSFRD